MLLQEQNNCLYLFNYLKLITMSIEDNPTTDPDGTIPVATAREWAANWRTYISTSGQDFITRSFLIPIIDFQNILLYNPDAENVRAFIGLTSATDPLTAKLILVPVTADEELLYLPVYGGGIGETTSNVYDMTKACPPECNTPVSDTLDA
ncbi:MAG: hypothetical protein JWP37_2522 [Mucilaginibacter sp.]|nr:hypothetical protein [Mucilaginibacter sp.]